MAKGGKHIVLAWLLIASLMPVHIVKALHFHNVTEDISSHSNIPHSHDPDNCCICQFFLSPFIESERIQTDFILPFISFEWISPESKVRNSYICSLSIRAPPVYSVFSRYNY